MNAFQGAAVAVARRKVEHNNFRHPRAGNGSFHIYISNPNTVSNLQRLVLPPVIARQRRRFSPGVPHFLALPPARRAGGVLQQPRFDALGVEVMAAAELQSRIARAAGFGGAGISLDGAYTYGALAGRQREDVVGCHACRERWNVLFLAGQL